MVVIKTLAEQASCQVKRVHFHFRHRPRCILKLDSLIVVAEILEFMDSIVESVNQLFNEQ